MINKLVVLVAALLAGVLVPSATALASSEREAEAELATFTIDVPSSTVTAEIEFVDTGSSLNVKGEAKGLVPGERYISLIYGNGSVSTGPRACLPAAFLSQAKMFLGMWVVNPDGEGTLNVTKTGASYTPIGTFATVSVRVLRGSRAVRVACGDVIAED